MSELKEILKNISEEKNEKIIPENIKTGVVAFGVEGIFTADADATAADIAKDKIAYVNGEKVVGTMEVSDNKYNALIGAPSAAFMASQTIKVMDFTDVDTSKVNNMQQGFSSVYYLEEVIGLKLPNATILASMFYQHTSIKRVDVSCSSKTTRMESAFQQCTKLEYVSVDKLDSSKVSLFNSMFSNCTVLKNLGAINMSSATSISSMFTNCKNLENLGGFVDLGKGFTNTTANNYNYALDLTAATLLTHESLMNVINNLYDLNLTYNVASGGTLTTQSLKIGSANIEKLTAEEIAIATNKGWTVS